MVVFETNCHRKEETFLYNCTIIPLTSFLTALKDRESYEDDSKTSFKAILNIELPGEVKYFR